MIIRNNSFRCSWKLSMQLFKVYDIQNITSILMLLNCARCSSFVEYLYKLFTKKVLGYIRPLFYLEWWYTPGSQAISLLLTVAMDNSSNSLKRVTFLFRGCSTLTKSVLKHIGKQAVTFKISIILPVHVRYLNCYIRY